MQLESPRSARALHRSRGLIVTATTAILLVLTGAWASVALALPPGGPVERRAGATVAITNTFVRPAVEGDAATGRVEFTGSGFTAGEVLLVKVDDGEVAPDKATRPAPPAGVTPQSDDWVAIAVATPGGTISGTVDLHDVADSDASKVVAGKHLLRFVSSEPRSIHADFLVRATGPAQATLTPTVAVAPPTDQPVSWDVGAPYAGIPSLLPGSKVPYRVSGFGPRQIVNIKVDDTNLAGTTLPGGAWAQIQADSTGSASGTIDLPAGAFTPGAHWLRFLAGSIANSEGVTGPPRSVTAPYAVDAAAAARTVDVAAAGQRGRTVALSGSGLKKQPWYLNFGTGNTGDGQTVTARIDGTGTPFHVRANDDGTLAADLPIPAGTSLGTHKVVLWVGFRAGSDFPQTVQERTFEVTEFVPDPVVVAPPADTPPAVVTPPVTATPAVTTPKPATPAAPAAPAARPPTISTSALKATKKGRITLSLVRPSVATKVAVSVRTKAKIRVAGRRTKKTVTLVRTRTVTLKAGSGKQKTALSLLLTTEGRAALRKARTLKVVVRVAPTTKGAKAVTKTVNLRG